MALVTLVCAVAAVASTHGMAAEHADELEGCPSLAVCLSILEIVVPAKGDGSLHPDASRMADSLRRFGEPAKQELLRRATGAHPGWRNIAGAILMYWRDWSPSDVPRLRAALQLDHGGWIARPLVTIATREAIEALVEDLVVAGADSQSGWALEQIGAQALPHLVPVLKEDRHASAAATVIRRIGNEALIAAPEWTSLALSADQPKGVRLAALRGLAAMGDGARQHGSELRGLLESPDVSLRDQAIETLIAIHDPAVVTTVAERCNPSGATPFEHLPLQTLDCISRLAAFGEGARAAGPYLMRFLESRSGTELATAITALGYTGYDVAVPEMERLLRSPDWRVVYAAVRSLGWLGATTSIPALQQVASRHWLPELRNEARAVIDALNSDKGGTARPSSFEGPSGARRLFFFDGMTLRSAPSCSSQQWEWQGFRFSRPLPSRSREVRLPLGTGELIGTDIGEWGGELRWKQAQGEAQLLIKDNVVAIEPTAGGAIVLFGLAHLHLAYGYAVRVSQPDAGNWSLSEVARLPGPAGALAPVGPNLFAAWSAGGVVVFSDEGIVGLATCSIHN